MTPTSPPDALTRASHCHFGHLLLRDERDAAIRAARAGGATTADIARATGLAATAVRRVLTKVSDADAYRKAQANRLVRYCAEQGANVEDVMAGRVTLDLDPICGPDGKIEPEAVDDR